MPRRLDLLPALAAVIVTVFTVLYLALVALEGGRPAGWPVTVLVMGLAGTTYASSRRAPFRRVVLTLCAILLGALGYVSVLTIGPPLLLAAALCIAAVLRGRPARDWRDAV